ncbi:isoamylase [Treponema sp. OMZ 840]|uniref:glycogen-binding domain-containing protein n=1 Tax=Treponema sp. OMZ 840 TaxID=244313 RepID=UPI003D8B669D
MKRIYIFILYLCFVFLSSAYAVENDIFGGNQSVQDTIIAHIKMPQAPLVIDDYILFTAEGSARHTGIAFDFENYRYIHSFKRLVKPNSQTEHKGNILFYVLKIPHDIRIIKYRLVIDGLWTTDPLNPNGEFAETVNVNVSKVVIDKPIQKRSAAFSPTKVRFVYEGESGQKIRVGGTFTNWDSFIYELQEISPGFYQLELPLPKGEYYYAFYKGMSAFPDETNPRKVYTADGRIASVLRVQ